MSKATSLFVRSGALSLPLDATGESTLASLDPARDIVLKLLEAAINAELGPRWGNAAGGTGLAGTKPVADTLPMQPTSEVLRERDCRFPLLCVYRPDQDPELKREQYTLDRSVTRSSMRVEYILGTLGVDGIRQVGDVRRAVKAIVEGVIDNGGHRAYQTVTTASGIVQSSDVLRTGAGLNRADVVNYIQGEASFGEGSPVYLAAQMTIAIEELDYRDTSADAWPLTGATFKLGSKGDEGVAQLIEADTNAPDPKPPPVG